jgi:chromosome segregation ATPase
VLQGLLGKYRSMLMQLQDELLSRAAVNRGTAEHEMTLERQLLQLQRDLADALRDKNSAIEDRERVYEMAELLKAKFETLMNEKLAQSQELAQSKEDNVVLARSLMDKNLELVDFKEQSEKEAFELASQLMAARNHIAELDGAIEALQKVIADKEGEIEKGAHDMGVLRAEITELNGQIEDRTRLIQAEKDKAIELGAELLTLVNRKDLLQRELDALAVKHEAALAELKEKATAEDELKAEIAALDKEVRHKEEQMFELNKHSAAIELEAKQAKLEADQLALQCREKLMMMAKPGTTNTEAAISGAKYEELQQSIRKGAKVIKELERNLRRAQVDLEETRKEKVQLGTELGEVREKYREKLSSLLIHDGDPAYHHSHAKLHHRAVSRKSTRVGSVVSAVAHSASGQQKSNNELDQEEAEAAHRGDPSAQPSGALTAAAQLQHQLLDSYAERESAQGEALHRALQQCVSMKLAYRELYDKYRTTMDVVEEQVPKASAAKLKPLEEQLRFAEADVSVRADDIVAD